MLDPIGEWFATAAPAILTAGGLTPEQNLVRAGELAARAEAMIELAEAPARRAAAEGGDPAEHIEAEVLSALYGLAAIARTKLAVAGIVVGAAE